ARTRWSRVATMKSKRMRQTSAARGCTALLLGTRGSVGRLAAPGLEDMVDVLQPFIYFNYSARERVDGGIPRHGTADGDRGRGGLCERAGREGAGVSPALPAGWG